jgi:glycosyltransferase involved in cell wall biosynthesis
MASPRILIDGYNLALKQGTGIKTYTVLLEKALRSLDMDTGYLFGHPIPVVDDPLLREVLFYDENPMRDHTPYSKTIRKLEHWYHAGLNKAPPVQKVPDNGVVVISEMDKTHERAFNGPKLWDIAWRRSLSFKKPLDFTMPEKFDAFHMTYPLPVRPKGAVKKIVTIHDVIPLRLPYTTTDDKTELLRRHRDLVRDSDLIFTVSEFSKGDIVKLLGADPEKIVVTHQPSRFAPLKPTELRERAKVLRRFELEDKGYILFVGAIEPKKNLGRLLKAYIDADMDVPIVIAGPRGWMWADDIGWLTDQMEKEGKGGPLAEKVLFLNHVSFADLRIIMSGAMAMTFPSLYEGYGLPVVEAMSFGVPVLTSRASSLPEVCGDAALYVDPFDVRDMREKLERLVGDQPLRDYLSQRGLARSEQLSAANFAEQVAAGYRKIGLID